MRLLALLLKQAYIVGQDPRLRHDLVFFAELAHLSKDVSVHKVFAPELPSAGEVIVVLVHVVVSEGLGLEWRTPHDIPLRSVCLHKASPTERICHAVIGVNAISNLILHFELVLLHLENMLLVDGLFFLGDAGWVLKEYSGRSARERAFTEIDWHVLGVWVNWVEVVALFLILLHLVH